MAKELLRFFDSVVVLPVQLWALFWILFVLPFLSTRGSELPFTSVAFGRGDGPLFILLLSVSKSTLCSSRCCDLMSRPTLPTHPVLFSQPMFSYMR